MALPVSGQLGISQINTELGRANNAPNSTLRSLAYLAKLGSTPYINRMGENKISHWYGYSNVTPQSGSKLNAVNFPFYTSYSCITPDKSKIILSGDKSGKVFKFNVSTNTISEIYSTLAWVGEIACDNTYIYVLDYYYSTIVKLDMSGSVLQTYTGTDNNFSCITLDSTNNKLYYLNAVGSTHYIGRIDLATHSVNKTWATLPTTGDSLLYSNIILYNSKLHYVHSTDNRLRTIDVNTGTQSIIGTTIFATATTKRTTIVNSNGDFYIGSFESSKNVVKITSSGTTYRPWAYPVGGVTNAIAVDASYLYVSSSTAGYIDRFGLGGSDSFTGWSVACDSTYYSLHKGTTNIYGVITESPDGGITFITTIFEIKY